MIFITVGTQFPFDRLIKAVDSTVSRNGHIGKVFGQIGKGNKYVPNNMEWAAALEKEKYDDYFKNASAIIGHAGMGTITLALQHNKPLLVMPRLKKYKEVVNDHQLAIASKFEQLGHILVAYNEEDLPNKIKELESFVPQQRKTNIDAVVQRISIFLNELEK